MENISKDRFYLPLKYLDFGFRVACRCFSFVFDSIAISQFIAEDLNLKSRYAPTRGTILYFRLNRVNYFLLSLSYGSSDFPQNLVLTVNITRVRSAFAAFVPRPSIDIDLNFKVILQVL